MILADTELGARIDQVEARLSTALAEAVQRRNPRSDAFALAIGRGAAVYAGADSPANKIIGIGFEGIPEGRILDEMERRYFERNSPVQAEVSTLAKHDFHACLSRRGYVLRGFEDVLGLELADEIAEPRNSGEMSVEPVTRDALPAWMEAIITGFGHPDETGAGSGVPVPPRRAIEEAFCRFAETPGFHPYLVRIGDAVAGGGGLRVDLGIGQLCGAATLPGFRRRGAQTALLRRRLRDALLMGCDLAVMTAQPGSKSHFNAQRQGFSLLYSRALLVKEPPEHAE
jgi:hypothetical protein